MLYWYKDIMLDDKYKKNTQKHIKRITRYYNADPKSKIFRKKKSWWERFIGKSIPWKEYFVILISESDKDLFDVMSTRNFIWRHYARRDVFVVGIYASEDAAVNAITAVLRSEYEKDADYDPKKTFADETSYVKEFDD